MSLAEKLKQEQLDSISGYAIEFAENIEPKLFLSAQKGFTAYSISLENRDDNHILENPIFLGHLEALLDGCTVEISKDEYINTITKGKYYKRNLVISWGGKS